jgi:hypothetical protein
MSVDNTFDFTAPGYSLEQVCDEIKAEFAADINYTIENDRHVFYSKLIWFSPKETIPYVDTDSDSLKEYTLSIYRDVYHFTPDYSILFSWNKNDYFGFEILEASIMNFIMKKFNGDACYLTNMASPRLWRHNGTLYLDSKSDTWVREGGYSLTHLFDMPFEWMEFPDSV